MREPREVADQVALGDLGQPHGLVAETGRARRARRAASPGTPVVRSWHAARSATDSSKIVGSASRPEERCGPRAAAWRAHRAAFAKAAANASISARVRRSVTAIDDGVLCGAVGQRRVARCRERRSGDAAEEPLVGEPSRAPRRRAGRSAPRTREGTAPVTTRRDAAARGQLLEAVVRPLRAARRDLGEPFRAEPAELDRRGHGHQRLVRAHVGRRLLAADVLLARAQRRHVAARAVDVDGLADEAPGEASHLARERTRRARGTGRRRTAACRAPGPRRRRRRRRGRPASAARRAAIGSAATTSRAPAASAHAPRRAATSSRQPSQFGLAPRRPRRRRSPLADEVPGGPPVDERHLVEHVARAARHRRRRRHASAGARPADSTTLSVPSPRCTG